MIGLEIPSDELHGADVDEMVLILCLLYLKISFSGLASSVILICLAYSFVVAFASQQHGNAWATRGNNSTRFLLMLVWEGHLDWAHHTDFMGSWRERAVTTHGDGGVYSFMSTVFWFYSIEKQKFSF